MNIFNKKPYLIAKLYYDFDDSKLEEMELLIKEAKISGIDAVDLNYDDACGFNLKSVKEIAELCEKNQITLISTPYDFKSSDELDELVDIYRISSSDLTNIPFIKHVACKNKSLLLTTGAGTMREIKNAVKAIEEVSVSNIALIHTILSYPTNYEDANLLMIKDLAQNFPDYEIGYCDYTIPDDNMFILTTAYNYGAVIIEKEFSLDKTVKPWVMDSKDVFKFKNNLLFLSKINGYSNKQPVICESSNSNMIRKSIVAKKDIDEGETISENNIIFKKPASGLSPENFEKISSMKAKSKIAKGSLIDFKMLK